MDINEISEIKEENTQENIETTIEEQPQEVQEEVENNDYFLPEDENGEPIYNSEWLKKYTSISPWLAIFLTVFVGLFVIVTRFLVLITFKAEYYSNIFLMLSVIIPDISILAIGIYTYYAFIKRKPNAVFWAKSFIILVFVADLLIALIKIEEGYIDRYPGPNIFFAIIWFIYICVSKNVQEVIPPSFRKISRKDWIISAAVFIVPIICFGIGYVWSNI